MINIAKQVKNGNTTLKVFEDEYYNSGKGIEIRYAIAGWICDLLGEEWDYTEDTEEETITFFDTNELLNDRT